MRASGASANAGLSELTMMGSEARSRFARRTDGAAASAAGRGIATRFASDN